MHEMTKLEHPTLAKNPTTQMMISTPLSSKVLSNTRSISLPNRSHPIIPHFNQHLQRLKPCDSTASPSLFSIAKKLKNLEHLHICVDDLLLLPHTQQVFSKECCEKWAEDTMDGYLRLVDAFATAKDFVSQSKQDVQDLLSALRRVRCGTKEDICGILASRKRAKKMIHKFLRNINSFKNKPTFLALEKNQETIAIISMLKEAESVTLDLVEVMFSNFSGARGYARTNGWSIVSKLIQTRKRSGNHTSEFEKLDEIVEFVGKFVGTGTFKGIEVEELQNKLKEMESSIQVVEDGIECLFKRLIKIRVSLLNMQSLQ